MLRPRRPLLVHTHTHFYTRRHSAEGRKGESVLYIQGQWRRRRKGLACSPPVAIHPEEFPNEERCCCCRDGFFRGEMTKCTDLAVHSRGENKLNSCWLKHLMPIKPGLAFTRGIASKKEVSRESQSSRKRGRERFWEQELLHTQHWKAFEEDNKSSQVVAKTPSIHLSPLPFLASVLHQRTASSPLYCVRVL